MTGGADPARLSSLIEPVLAAMNMDLEGVKVASAGRRRVLRIIVDADGGVSLDDIADVSRQVSARLDASTAMGDTPYTLEVSSPGVDRPLTQARHWRRAAGRLVAVPLNAQDHEQDSPDDHGEYQARVIGADQDRVTLEIDGARRTFSYAELGPGRVQVEFGRLDEAADLDEPAGLDDAADLDEAADLDDAADLDQAADLDDAADNFSRGANVDSEGVSQYYLDAERASDFEYSGSAEGDGADEEDPDGH